MPKSKNHKLLKSLSRYCEAHPEERFWQAVRNWGNFSYLVAVDKKNKMGADTFYWTKKNS